MKIKRFRHKRHFHGRMVPSDELTKNHENNPPNNAHPLTRYKNTIVSASKSKTLKRQKKSGLIWQKIREINACNSFSELDEIQPKPKFK